MLTCASCGRENPADARFCNGCGAPIERARTRRQGVRKIVTVLFTDITGSTALGERLDPESLRHLMTRYFAELTEVIERHGGTVEKFIGDAVMAVFGIPQAHEDDALRAVRAALGIDRALASLNAEISARHGRSIRVRTGINTGEVVAGDSSTRQSLVTGDPVNVAARLEQAAAPGEILIGPETHALVRDAVSVEPLEPLTLKGKTEPVAAFRLIGVTPGASGHERRLDAPLVGRDPQLLLLREAFETAVSHRTCHLFTVLGQAGVGKSRLVEEFVRGVARNATVLRGRCLSYGEGITFWPIGEAVVQAAGIDPADASEEVRRKIVALLGQEPKAEAVAERVAGVTGLADGASAPEDTSWAIRKVLVAVARSRPLVLVLDDLHWAEPTLLDVIVRVAEWTRDAPILLLCMARPELLDERPGWGGGKPNASSILLEPLSDEDSRRLMSHLLGGADLATEARTRIVASAEGNPLFVEEMLSMLVDDGMLRRTNGHWEAASDLSDVGGADFDQGVVDRSTRSPGNRGTARDRTRCRGGQDLPSRGGCFPVRGRRRAEGRWAPRHAGPQRAHPAGGALVCRREGVRLPAHPHPRGRIRGDAEGDPWRYSSPVRRLADGDRRQSAWRVRGDRRIPPRARSRLPTGSGNAG